MAVNMRGPSNAESLVCEAVPVTASGAQVAFPCMLHWIVINVKEGTADRPILLADQAASGGAAVMDLTVDVAAVTTGMGIPSITQLKFDPPIMFRTALFCSGGTYGASASLTLGVNY